MNQTFLAQSSWTDGGAGRVTGMLSPAWAQGRATFGGLLAAAALRPMLRVVPVERTLRTLNVAFVGPLAADTTAHCDTVVLRAGKALTTVESRIVQDGQTLCVATAFFGSDRASEVHVPVAVTKPAIDFARLGDMPFDARLMPRFLQQFATRVQHGFVFSGAAEPHIVGGCRFRNEARAADYCDLLGLIDAWPPTILPMLKTPVPASTVSWTIDFLTSAPQGRTDEFFTYEAKAVAASAGYAQTEAWLWDPQGTPVARSVQLCVVFG